MALGLRGRAYFARYSTRFRSSEQKALAGLAAEIDQLVEYLLGLDPLGGGLQSKRATETEDGLDDLGLLGVVQHLHDEGAVDLERIEA